MSVSRSTLVRFVSTALVAVAAFGAQAQNWPAKQVNVIVPWPPGGPSDIAARPVSAHLQQTLGQPFVIENRGGAGGNTGSAQVARATPDGYTLLITSSAPIVINPSLYKKMPFDPAKDLQPITNLLRVPLVLAVHPSVPAKNLTELLAWMKTQPEGKTVIASAGNGTPQHLTAEIFKDAAKVNVIHVPYQGSAPAITELLGGHTPMMFDSTVAILPHIKAGKLRAIALTGARRSSQLPDVPTFAEQGLPAVETYAWYGLFGPAGMPADVLAKINREAQAAMKAPEYQKVLADTGAEYVGDTPENFTAFVRSEAAKWGKAVKASGATID
ncbi:Bug family tripartite tricarboxylate transporter substrate binding protein [Uliginosibacterium sp. H1]|uniref:Bug family tripartite tricarboxylate transporter substrate binding protein n=1 Tax=Uliginosibacterium sp. H1 TaxID=3114757 RepID=UPI002E1818BB|nr:tripartite tricarboxylate transporter substrate binding protein [Uliginosibacterium sp. H1]